MNYILTNGKEYVMENPYKPNDWIPTTYVKKAKLFEYKRAKRVLQIREKKYSWINSYYMVAEQIEESKNIPNVSSNYKGRDGIYVGDNDIDFDDELVEKIYKETQSIIGLAGWNLPQLNTYEEKLLTGLSKYDSAESDICHALQKYKKDNNGKKPQAHKMAKIGYLLDEVRDKHKNIKQCLSYIKVLKNACENGYTIEKLKLELSKATYAEYKGRTEYYRTVLEILKG